ncbi:GIY-YIG nuclease family protein [Seonamhaeicola sp.]|uniref:GIY-YIG nuclease family protein n=1 Tax=Seonamhaeicola sp. TaxID=1912245 RepID=UPI002639F013|nr:GIY-YIG nuclease family protein [Seonamhaeicola sp.]
MAKRSYHNYWVYIITNKPNGVLYIGVTGGLDDRMERHVAGKGAFFAVKYKLKILVYYEEFQFIEDAIKREKQLKNWHRQWKINLIESVNPNWDNLWSPLDPETSSG